MKSIRQPLRICAISLLQDSGIDVDEAVRLPVVAATEEDAHIVQLRQADDVEALKASLDADGFAICMRRAARHPPAAMPVQAAFFATFLAGAGRPGLGQRDRFL